MTTTENKVIQCRRDTAANWASNNPVPKAGELCFETDTGITKIGDGSTAYNSLVPFRQTTATTTELNKLHSLSTTNTELGYVHGVTSAIQTQINAKFEKSDIQTSFGETLSDEKVASEKLVKNTFDTKQNGITLANDSGLKAGVISSMSIIGEDNEGRAYTEPKTYAKMLSAAHSTYDSSKFTVVGSPNITDDGIASGFSTSNRISTGILSQHISGTNWKIRYKAFIPETTNFNILQTNSDSVTSRKKLQIAMWGSVAYIYLGDGTNSQDFSVNGHLTNANILFELVRNGANYSMNLYDDNGTLLGTNSTPVQYDMDIASIAYIGGMENSPFTGSFDLKYFEVEVENKIIFSGNKTGIDTIKPDDYAVVGSPTISADGVALTGYGRTDNSNKFNSNTFNVLSNNQVFESIVYIEPLPSGYEYPNQGQSITSFSVGNSYIRIYRTSLTGTNYVHLEQQVNGSWVGNSYNTRWALGTTFTGWVKFKIYYDIADTCYKCDCYTYDNGIATFVKTMTCNYTGNAITGSGWSIDFVYGQYQNYGKIDLNSIKVYDNGLVYQPCLKIPYTETADDKKFIDIVYKNRAKDMSEQFGIAPYTIMDESNSAFILPYGSVDSKVAPKIVVEHYEDGASTWTKYLDRTLVQTGLMVADTDVTFPCSDEFADTNYTLSCPFSAKTTSGFTPSASGTYIAVGKF